jgi:chaperonin GroES
MTAAGVNHMAFRPLHARVLVNPEKGADRTPGGLYIPENGKEKPQIAKVIAIGPDAKHVAVGDRILFGKYTGEKVVVEEEDMIVLQEEDILGVVEA